MVEPWVPQEIPHTAGHSQQGAGAPALLYYGWYTNRTRGRRRRTSVPESAAAEAVPAALAQARRRWAELLRRIFEVDPLRCPRCGDAMRVVGIITQPRVIDRILAHLRRPAPPARRARPPQGVKYDTVGSPRRLARFQVAEPAS